MASKIFVDTNIIIDIILEREPFFNDSQKAVLELAKGSASPYISGSSVTDLFYICRKSGMEREALLDYLKELLEAFEVLIVDKDVVTNAISSEIKDFEDAVQIMACRKEKVDLILTRNKKDFKNQGIKVLTPKEYLEESWRGVN